MPPSGYLSSAAIEACLQYLASTYTSICQLITLPEASIEGRTIHGVKIASGGGHRHGVLFIGGVHARELINPDLLVSLALRLCQAYTSGSGLSFGPKSYSAGQVKLIIEALDVFFLPLVNPDGRIWVQSPAGYAMWRKNRNPNSGQPCMGVDVNRNYEFLWLSGIGTSSNSCSNVFKGAAAFSEPETRNVRWMLDTHPNIECFVDVHSFSELILYPWGDDDDQTTDPSQNFQNPVYNGMRGVSGSGYAEYIPQADLDWLIDTGAKLRDAIAAVRGRVYTLQQAIALYPTSGTSKDYSYSRHFVDTGKRRVYGYTLETATEFQPPYSEALNVIDEASAGLVEFCLACMCVVEETARGTSVVESLADLSRFREEHMMKSRGGRELVGRLNRHSGELLGALASDKSLLESAQDVLGRVAKVVASRGQKQPTVIDDKLIELGEKLATRLEGRGSRELQSTITELRRYVKTVKGKSAVEALEAIDREHPRGE